MAKNKNWSNIKDRIDLQFMTVKIARHISLSSPTPPNLFNINILTRTQIVC